MSEEQAKKSGAKLIIGGVVVLLITLGGFYISQNPQLISEWQYKRDSARQDSMRDILLTASDECLGVETTLFSNSCAALEGYDYEGDLNWKAGLSERAASCGLQSYRDTTTFKLKYDGDPVSHLENMQTGEAIAIHLCGISEDVTFYYPDFEANDAKALIDKWHLWRHSEGNYYH